jgi:hypothetical protein
MFFGKHDGNDGATTPGLERNIGIDTDLVELLKATLAVAMAMMAGSGNEGLGIDVFPKGACGAFGTAFWEG